MKTNSITTRSKVKNCPRRVAIQAIYDTQFTFAIEHDTQSAQIAGDVILATYNSEVVAKIWTSR